MDMIKVKGEAIWQPQVLGRMKLDERRFMYAVRAPFDMPADVPNLIDTMVGTRRRALCDPGNHAEPAREGHHERRGDRLASARPLRGCRQ